MATSRPAQGSAEFLTLEKSFEEGFGLQVSKTLAQTKEWDYKSKSPRP